jgi:hypothetical protein
VLVDIGARLGDGDKIPRHVGSREEEVGIYWRVHSSRFLKFENVCVLSSKKLKMFVFYPFKNIKMFVFYHFKNMKMFVLIGLRQDGAATSLIK